MLPLCGFHLHLNGSASEKATPRLLGVIALRVKRLATSNYPSAYAACAAEVPAARAARAALPAR